MLNQKPHSPQFLRMRDGARSLVYIALMMFLSKTVGHPLLAGVLRITDLVASKITEPI